MSRRYDDTGHCSSATSWMDGSLYYEICWPGAWRFTMKVCRRIGGLRSGMPSAPARLFCVVVRLMAGRMEV